MSNLTCLAPFYSPPNEAISEKRRPWTSNALQIQVFGLNFEDTQTFLTNNLPTIHPAYTNIYHSVE